MVYVFGNIILSKCIEIVAISFKQGIETKFISLTLVVGS